MSGSADEPVSRETPPAPPWAPGVFPVRLEVVEAYAGLLAGEGVVRGLIGPREVPRLWERHLGNCALVGRLVPHAATVCDVGTGAGLPGLVLAISRPDLGVTLVEPLLRRTRFLEEAVTTLGLDNVEVVRARAEELHGRREFDVVTSRAVAPLDRLLAWSMPLVSPGGVLLAMKGQSAAEELAAAAATVAVSGGSAPTVEELTAPGLEVPTRVVRVEARGPSRLRSGTASRSGAQGKQRTGRRPRKGRGSRGGEPRG